MPNTFEGIDVSQMLKARVGHRNTDTVTIVNAILVILFFPCCNRKSISVVPLNLINREGTSRSGCS